MSREWLPQVVHKPVPHEAKAEQPAPQVVVMKQDQPRPIRWVFTPRRDSQNLIVEVIAEPIY